MAISTTLRRTLRAGLAAMVCAGLPLAGAGAQTKTPIKIGFIVPTTGGFAPSGEECVTGAKMYLESIHYEVAGRKIELIVEDSQGKPDVGLTKAQKLVERDGAQMIMGIVSSAVALAINDYARDKKVPFIITCDAGANELTMPGPLANPYLVRTSQNGRTPSAAAADFMVKKGWKNVAVLASDYAGGFDTIGGFADALCRLGGKVTQEQYPPLNTTDFGPYATNLDRKADAVAMFLPGGGGLRFIKQFVELGLKDKLPVMDLYAQSVYEPFLPQLGDSAIGIYSTLHYASPIKSPMNDAFVKAYFARVKHQPSDNAPDGWVGAKAFGDAAAAVGGNVENAPKFIEALKAVKFDSPKGPIALDKYGQVIQSMYVRQTEKAGDGYVNSVVATYPNIDQFWPLTFEQYESYKYRYAELKGSLTDCAKVLEKK